MILETDRLFLREFSVSDAEKLFLLNRDPEVLKFTGDYPFDSINQTIEFIENYSEYSDNGYGRWAVILKFSNQFIGWCGLKYHPEHAYTDLGFRFFIAYWNKEYATEAGRGVVYLAFSNLNLNSLVARVETRNTASIAVLKKLGFISVKEIEFNSSLGNLFEIKK